MGWKKRKTKTWRSTRQDSSSQYQHTLSHLSVLRRQIQFNSAEADWMSGDVLSWSSRNLAIWKLILCLKCSVVCQSSEVFHNMLWLEAQAAFSCWFDKDSKELQLIESDWEGFFVIMFFFPSLNHSKWYCTLPVTSTGRVILVHYYIPSGYILSLCTM